MLRNLGQLFRYRGLVQSLVARELKARYRGSVLGFFWSFINPLLLLLIYTFVFRYIIESRAPKHDPYALFMFCGILPWSWFSASLTESSNALIAGGNLIKKVLFPAEILPIVERVITAVEYQEVGRRGLVSIPFTRRLIVLGYLLEVATPQERAEFLAPLPRPARLAYRLIGQRQHRNDTTRLRGPLQP